MCKVLTKENFIEKAKSIHGDKYDYSLVEPKGFYESVIIICPEHGQFEQTIKNHYRGGCKKCSSVGKFNRDFKKILEEMKIIHEGRYSYEGEPFKKVGSCNNYYIKAICPEHGMWDIRIDHHLNGKGCRSCSYKKGWENRKVKTVFKEDEYLTEEKLGVYLNMLFSTEFLKGIKFNRFKPDLVNEDLKIIVEFNGFTHYTRFDVQERDFRKYKLFKENGYKVIQIPYFVQLTQETLEFYFRGFEYKKDLIFSDFPHGFISKDCVRPRDFNKFGTNRFYDELEELPKNVKEQILKTLTKEDL